MSTLSLLEKGGSDRLAKRFAHLASSYIDHPTEAKTSAAQIPLENLFRILQMYRYDAFSDERRSGVLELKSFEENGTDSRYDEDQWHQKIERALSHALTQTFGELSKEEAIQEIQTTLTWLATNKNIPSSQVRARVKTFLDKFEVALD